MACFFCLDPFCKKQPCFIKYDFHFNGMTYFFDQVLEDLISPPRHSDFPQLRKHKRIVVSIAPENNQEFPPEQTAMVFRQRTTKNQHTTSPNKILLCQCKL
jgi:hypothetical protein